MRKFFAWCAAAGLCAVLSNHIASAQDIDIYTGMSSADSNPPTILLVWDNTAKTSASANSVCAYSDGVGTPSLGTDTVAGMEQCAMVNALLALKNAGVSDQVRVGLMVFNHNKFSNNGNGNCGYLYAKPESGISALINSIRAFDKNNQASSIELGDTMAEAWAMLNGKSTSCSGVDYSALSEVATQCRDAVLVYIGNAFTNSNPKDNAGVAESQLKLALEDFGYVSGTNGYSVFTSPIAVAELNGSGTANSAYWADEWTRFMKRVPVIESDVSDRNVTSYTISVTDFANQGQAQPVINYYSEMATQGGGKTFLIDMNDSSGLTKALLSIFNEVQAKNSVFASATLPVTANTQGTYLNQVFVAMFRPDGDANPRWLGNLKQYQLGLDAGGNIVLTDSTENPNTGAVTSKTNPTTGALSPEAVSFWTTNTPSPAVTNWPTAGFWINSPSGSGLQFDSPDGDLVEKGGAAEMAHADNLTATYADSSNDNARNLWTCDSVGGCGCDSVGGCGSGLTEFSTANTALTTNAASLFGVGGDSSVTLTAGVAFKVGATTCKTPGTGNNQKECTFTVPLLDSSLALSAGNLVTNTVTGGASCTLPTSYCTVATVLSGSPKLFTFTKSGLTKNTTYTIPQSSQFYKADSSVTVTFAAAHGFSVGDSVTFTNCTGQATSSNVYGLSGLPSSSDTKQVTITSKTAKTFTFDLGAPALTLTDASVGCTVKSTITAANLINWVRGGDIIGNEEQAGPGSPVTVRPSLHGDVLHSRPAVINYGGTTGVVVFYGANDGVFRAVNGNQTASIGGIRAGGELWGFIAPEFHGKFKRLLQNTPLVDIAGVLDTNKQPKDYFFDGSTTVLRDTRSSTTASTKGKTYIYLTARRGGRLIYALDVTDPKTPEFLWSKTNANIPELGQTWSQPKVALLRGRANPVLIMGAGYAPEQDADPVPTTSHDSMGRGVLILDAVTGDVVWAALADCGALSNCTPAALTHSVAADVTLLDRNSDGYVDRVYAADTGANIWRIDLQPNGYNVAADPGTFKITKLAALGGSGNDARKFLFAPDVIPTDEFDAVMAISGDREHPLYTSATTAGMAYNVQNRIYMVKDKIIGSVMGTGFTALTNGDLVANPGQTQPFDATADTVNGYYLDLPNKGEKGVNAPVTVAGKTYFGTNYPDVPKTNACSADLGIARAYTLDFNTAKLQYSVFVGGGLPPSPVTGLVNIGGDTLPFIIGGSGPTTFDPSTPEIELSNNRKRAYWYAK
ncbi:pilus assembly protein [Azotobacter beijerinckii]|uniref:pilus assembly protein n=1 Tax=Azotobacter beijerinckii TaxID=170623 RepID=UPI00147C5A49|nr:PilC/PilY family type IV pilus protein [Azotobacter beijerinckii]